MLRASNCVGNLQGTDRDEAVKTRTLAEISKVVFVSGQPPESATRIRANNTQSKENK
jgi:hypothetical protein